MSRLYVLVLLLLLAASCRSDQREGSGIAREGKVVVTYWRHHNHQEVIGIKDLIQRFETRNPDVRIVLRTFPEGVYKTKLVASLSAGRGPDLINIHNSWAYGYIRATLILPVPGKLFTAGELEREFFPLVRSFSRHGLYYAVPIGGANLGLFYNRKLFREAGLDPLHPPRTWSEMIRMAKKLTRRDPAGRLVQSGAAIGTGRHQGWNYFVEGVLRQAGVEILAPDQRSVRWNTPGGAAALSWFTGFYTEHQVNSVMFPDYRDAFRLGLAGMVIDGAWQIRNLKKIAPDLDYSTAVVPSSDAGVRATYGTCWGNAVTSKTDHRTRAAAWRFVRFVTSYDSMKRWYNFTGEIPLRRRLLADHAWMAHAGRVAPFVKQMEYSFSSLKKNESEYKSAIIDAVDEVLLRGAAPSYALDRAARRINRVLRSE